jgi:hypothetical protein
VADASKNILKWIFKKQDGEGVSWIDLAQDRYKCRAIMNTVITPRPPYGRGGRGGEEFLTSQAAAVPVRGSTGRSTSECHRVTSTLFHSPSPILAVVNTTAHN